MNSGTDGVPIRDRDLTPMEVEQFRLLLSTFCDGSGARVKCRQGTVPDYRDFERVTAIVCGGQTPEDKSIFDVTVPVESQQALGISCKMAGTGLVSDPDTAFMELSNSAKKFDDDFLKKGHDWISRPQLAGPAIVDLVLSWHQEVSTHFDLDRSAYLLLTHNRDWSKYRLSTFSLDLKRIDPASLSWEMRNHRKSGQPNSLVGTLRTAKGIHRIWEFYPVSGGQLKYSPLWEWATWQSEWFELEEPPTEELKAKAYRYFPDLWDLALNP